RPAQSCRGYSPRGGIHESVWSAPPQGLYHGLPVEWLLENPAILAAAPAVPAGYGLRVMKASFCSCAILAGCFLKIQPCLAPRPPLQLGIKGQALHQVLAASAGTLAAVTVDSAATEAENKHVNNQGMADVVFVAGFGPVDIKIDQTALCFRHIVAATAAGDAFPVRSGIAQTAAHGFIGAGNIKRCVLLRMRHR